MDYEHSICKFCSSSISIENDKFGLVKCSNCKLIFSKRIYSELELIKVYDLLYNKSNAYSKHIKESKLLHNNKKVDLGKNKIKILNRLIGYKSFSFLEIGAGVGIVGEFLSKSGYKYTGIEIDKETAQKANRLGLNVINDSYKGMSTLNGNFDAIIAFEVIEHLEDLKLFFNLAKDHLIEKGKIAFTVPNYNKILNYNDKNKIYQDTPPVHLNFFTTENITKILEISGWDILYLKIRKWPYLNLKKIDTYKFIIKAILGNFQGPTILCIAQKQS